MNLPNYFLADLPPEATLSPAMITEACQTLKRNRERYLAGRSTEQSGANIERRGGRLVAAGQSVSASWRWSMRSASLGLNQSQALNCNKALLFFHAPPWKRAWTIFSGNSPPENFQALLVQELGDAVSVTGDAVSVDAMQFPRHAHAHVISGAARNFSSTSRRATFRIRR